MADIELLIKIPEEDYLRIAGGFGQEEDAVLLEKIFMNGILLPKHDRLVDAAVAADNIEAARYELSGEYEEGLHEAWEIVNSEDAVPTIIPATKEGESK